MITSRDAAFAFTLSTEGGLSLDPRDGGNFASGEAGVGPLIGSNFGVSAAQLVLYRHPLVVTAATMAAITKATAEAIWTPRCWMALNCDGLTAGLDLMVADHGYNRGLYASARALQRLCGAGVDGWLGSETVDAANKWAPGAHPTFDLSPQAIRRLQTKLNVTVDGFAGPRTLTAIHTHPAGSVMVALSKLADAQLADYRTLSQFGTYGNGWTTRVWNRLGAGLALV